MPRPKSSLLINEPPLQALPSLAKAIGLDAAVILQQIHYWLQASTHVQDDRPWIFNSYKDWAEQFPWLSSRSVQRHILKLEKVGILVSRQFDRPKGNATKWYAIDYDTLGGIVPKPDYPMTKAHDPSAKTAPSTYIKTTTVDTGPAPRKRTAPDERITEVFDAVLKHLGNPEIDPIPNHGKEAKFIKRMLARGFSVDQIIDFWKKKSAAKGGGYVTMVYVNEDIGKAPGARQPSLLPTEEELARDAEAKGLT